MVDLVYQGAAEPMYNSVYQVYDFWINNDARVTTTTPARLNCSPASASSSATPTATSWMLTAGSLASP